jgi:two-component system, OmpR family, sensor histidine kinase CpxA
MLPRFQPKLSTKIFLLSALNLVLIGAILVVFMRVQYRLDLQSFLLSPAHDRILSVGRQFALELRDTDSSGWDALLARYAQNNKVDLRLVDDDGVRLAGPSDALPQDVLETLRRQSHDHAHDSPLMFLGTTRRPTRHWVGVRIPVPSTGERHHLHGALIAASSSLIGTPFFFDPKPWLAVAFAVVFVSFLCWLPLVRRLTREVSYISHATGQIAEGRFKIQLPITRQGELGQLSAAINRMAVRLDGYVMGQRRFLGDAAHELCSPIARMQVALGILERSADDAQREAVADLHDDLQHMSTLVNDILSFSKTGMQNAPKIVAVSVADAVGRVLQRESDSSAQVTVHIPEDLKIQADPDLLNRALSNVFRNAMRYAGKIGPIEISAALTNGSVAIRVCDHGPGLAEKDLESIFEPFYRPEFARGRDTGGAGLGLAIVKTCVESCNGSVACCNRAKGGLEVEMRFRNASDGSYDGSHVQTGASNSTRMGP